MKISYSRLNHFRSCPRLYYWRFVQNLVPKKDPVPLIVGRAAHLGLAAHYSSQAAEQFIEAHFEEARKQAPWLQEELEDLARQERYVKFIITEYKKRWATEPWTMLAPEVQGSIPLGDHEFYFRTDGLISWRAKPWLLEHKTTSQMGTMFFKKFRMDGQITTYIYCVWKKLDTRPVGALINAIWKSKKLDRTDFARDVVMRSQEQLEEFMDQVLLQLDELSELESIAPNNKHPWTMHTNQCVAWNRTCDYLELCHKETPGLRDLFIQRPPDYVDLGNVEVVGGGR